MHSSKFIRLYASLNSEERNEIIGFYSFQQRKSNTLLERLFTFLRDQNLSVDNTFLEKRAVFELLYQSDIYSEQKIKDCLSKAYSFTLDYLNYKSYSRSLPSYYTDQELLRRNLLKDFLQQDEKRNKKKQDKKFNTNLIIQEYHRLTEKQRYYIEQRKPSINDLL